MGDNTTAALIFQFHKGTIRTGQDLSSDDFSALFQFHKGTIRTWEDRLCLEVSDISIP